MACLITDLRMPRLDGMTLFRRAIVDYPDLKIIIWTAWPHHRVGRSGEARRLRDYIERAPIRTILQVVRKSAVELRARSES